MTCAGFKFAFTGNLLNQQTCATKDALDLKDTSE